MAFWWKGGNVMSKPMDGWTEEQRNRMMSGGMINDSIDE